MPKPRRADVSIETVSINCPNKRCLEPVAEPTSGSLIWKLSDLHGDEVIVCPACRTQLILPSRLRLDLLGA